MPTHTRSPAQLSTSDLYADVFVWVLPAGLSSNKRDPSFMEALEGAVKARTLPSQKKDTFGACPGEALAATALQKLVRETDS